jgi:hypothetical protein
MRNHLENIELFLQRKQVRLGSTMIQIITSNKLFPYPQANLPFRALPEWFL